MRIQPSALNNIHTVDELASLLNVDIRAINYVTLTHNKCNTKGAECILPSALYNGGKCVMCQQSWYPCEYNCKGQRSKHCRGYGLFGPQFMRSYGSSGQPSACCCGSTLCEKIGYSHDGMFRLPQDREKCDEFLKILGVGNDRREEMIKHPRSYKVAPWHFSPSHRERNWKDGSWRIRKMAHYKDDNGKYYIFPPPNYSLNAYIQHEIESRLPRGSQDNTLPKWVQDLQKLVRNMTDIDSPTEQQPLKSTSTPKKQCHKVNQTSPKEHTPRQRKRPPPEQTELEEMRESNRIKDAEIASVLHRIEGLTALLDVKDDQIKELQQKVDETTELNRKMHERLEALCRQNATLSYDDLSPGGRLEGCNKDFTTT